MLRRREPLDRPRQGWPIGTPGRIADCQRASRNAGKETIEMQPDEAEIARTAHEIWEADGRPDGKAGKNVRGIVLAHQDARQGHEQDCVQT